MDSTITKALARILFHASAVPSALEAIRKGANPFAAARVVELAQGIGFDLAASARGRAASAERSPISRASTPFGRPPPGQA